MGVIKSTVCICTQNLLCKMGQNKSILFKSYFFDRENGEKIINSQGSPTVVGVLEENALYELSHSWKSTCYAIIS